MTELDTCDLLCLDLARAERLRRERLEDSDLARTAHLASSLADPTRLSLVATLAAGGELCVCDLAWVTERSEKLVSHHLRVLRSADVVAARRDGKMVMYSLTSRGREVLRAVQQAVANDAHV